MALLDPADCQRSHGFVQVIHDGEFLPRGHAPNELDLQSLHGRMGVREQGVHDRWFSLVVMGFFLFMSFGVPFSREKPCVRNTLFCKNLSLGYNRVASGQNSAPCRVVAGLRSPKPYIPGFFVLFAPFKSRRRERLFLCVIHAVACRAFVVNILNQVDGVPQVTHIPVLPFFVQTLKRPGEVVCDLQARVLGRRR